LTVPEAPLERTPYGLTPTGEGWYVVNLGEAPVLRTKQSGRFMPLEGEDVHFPQFGINVHIVEPGEPNGLYHAESNQEAFLVLHGECLLLVEGQERRLRQWDFVHFPPGTHHIAIGAGDGPCAILMVGTRNPDHTITYPVSEVAAKHGASAREATDSPREAYAHWDRETTVERPVWPLDQPQ
jgi:uncharacterized cupin superfamily protein